MNIKCFNQCLPSCFTQAVECPTLSTSSAPSSSSLCISTSPIHSETDPQEPLTQFFEYLMTLPGLRSEHKREALTKIRNVLVEDEWEIDLLLLLILFNALFGPLIGSMRGLPSI